MFKWLRKLFRRNQNKRTAAYFRKQDKLKGLTKTEVTAAVCSKASHDVQIRPRMKND